MSQRGPTTSRRKSQRIRLSGEVILETVQNGEERVALLRDLSISGCCVNTQTALSAREPYRIIFQFEQDANPVLLDVRVIWSRRDRSTVGGGVLSGLQFIGTNPDQQAVLRSLIDQRIWAMLSILNEIDLLDDLNDLEKITVSSVAVEDVVPEGHVVTPSEASGSIVIIRDGHFVMEALGRGEELIAAQDVYPGDVCGGPPLDPRGGMRLQLVAQAPSAYLAIPPDGFNLLREEHPQIAFKLLALFTTSLMERLNHELGVPQQ